VLLETCWAKKNLKIHTEDYWPYDCMQNTQ